MFLYVKIALFYDFKRLFFLIYDPRLSFLNYFPIVTKNKINFLREFNLLFKNKLIKILFHYNT